MSDEDILAQVYPDFAIRVRRVYADMADVYHRPMRPTQGFRSFEEQEKIFAQGRLLPGPIVTYARPGDSLHNYGLAVDSCFRGKDPYLEKAPPEIAQKAWYEYGKAAKAHGLTWGGDWLSKKVDRPHIQLTYGLTLHELKMLYDEGGLEHIWKYLDKRVQL